jgi:hypothetical protein
MNNYNDIINMPHHESTVYKRMPMINRAAQFSPFAALTGYEDAIEETGRLTTKRKEIDEYLKAEINDKLSFLAHSLETAPKVSITYYVPDLRKEGGSYVTITGTVKKVNTERKMVILDDNKKINISDIIAVEWIERYEENQL